MSNNKFTRYQREAVGLLSIGTFLEYFDLMLYVHMSVLLNELFFPQTDTTTAKLLGTTAFCITFIFRPIGGFVIGRIGDVIGRKFTIMITTFVMACTCLTMAVLPTYIEIGIAASVIVMLCRALQGFSSMGEVLGAQIYLSEILKNPHRCVASGMMGFSSQIGGLFALAVASFVLLLELNWRFIFAFGAFIAVVGVFARLRLRETPDFIEHKKRIEQKLEACKQFQEIKLDTSKYEEKVKGKVILAYFATEFFFPVSFCVAYLYIGDFMKEVLGLTAEEVIKQNFKVALFGAIGSFIVAYLAKKIHPIKTAMSIVLFFVTILPFIPYWLNNVTSLFSLLCLQCIIFSLNISGWGTLDSVFYKYFPILKRFTFMGITFGLATPLSQIVSTFGLIFIAKSLSHYALWILFIPVIIIHLWALFYLRRLEIKRGAYHNYPHEDPPHEDTAINEEDYDYEDLGDEYEPFTNKCEYSKNLMNKLNEFSKEKNAKLNMKLIDKAITFAKKWHGTQMRKTGDHPFYWHPLKVAEMVAERYCKTDMVIGAILHDTVEDSECTVELIEEKFNARIAEMVDRLTNKRFENGENIKLNFEETINRLQNVRDTETLFIKQMDRQHNLETIEGLKPHKQRKMAEETNDYFIRLIAIIGDKLNIHGKMRLENKMFKSCNAILKKKKR